MPMLQEKTNSGEASTSIGPESQYKQRRQMYVALGLLLTALIVVVVKDREFWFPSAPPSIEETAADSTPSMDDSAPGADNASPSVGAPSVGAASEPSAKAPAHVTHAKPKSHSAPAAAVPPRRSAEEVPAPAITATRAALPPLEVEVVAGDQHRTLQPPNPTVRVDLQPGTAPQGAAAVASSSPASAPLPGGQVATNAGERVRLSPDTAQVLARPVEPNYPMLAKQMKVQGSVILQALIGKEGSIQDLRVLSGPAILSTAAMDAVRQWRFRPYYQSGQAIETEARITVNFTISTY
jgi:TonB family protein